MIEYQQTLHEYHIGLTEKPLSTIELWKYKHIYCSYLRLSENFPLYINYIDLCLLLTISEIMSKYCFYLYLELTEIKEICVTELMNDSCIISCNNCVYLYPEVW